MLLKRAPAKLHVSVVSFSGRGSGEIIWAFSGRSLVALLLALAFLLTEQTAQARVQSSLEGASRTAKAVPTHTVPVGTVLYLRLKTPISTISSHLEEPVKAEVERSVHESGSIAVPVGAVASGYIARLIPSSSPTDRAKLLLQFNALKLPGQSSVPLVCHLNEVSNARETVLPNGTIQGVLASELPVTLLNSAIEKLQKRSGNRQQAQQAGETWFGSPDTSINYSAGTEFSVVLDKPLRVSGHFKPLFANQIPDNLKEAIMQLLAQAPRRVVSKKGNKGGPVNLILIGSKEEIRAAFDEAGWTAAQDKNANSLWKTFEAVVKGKGYDAAPMSTLYLYGQPEEMAFEKMLNTFTKRHHLRIWKAPVTAPDGREIWLVVANHDNGFDIRPGVISHSINPHVDLERAKVGADLGMTGSVAAEELLTPSSPVFSGLTATGGKWESDGKVLVVDFKPPSRLKAAGIRG